MKAILLDLFDTLVDLHFDRLPRTDAGEHRAPSTVRALHTEIVARGHAVELQTLATVLKESDRELSASHIERGFELPTRLRFERLTDRLGVADPGLPEVLTRTHMRTLRSVSEVPGHHRDVVAGLAERYRLALCSNFSHAETAEEILADAGLLEHFSVLAISERVGVRKPRPEIFAHALDGLGVEPAHVVHVGDRLDDDVAGAAALGIRAVWLTRRVADPEKALGAHSGAAPDHVITDLSELASLLARES